ncbi:hypothetical protein NDU88_007804 [Pleurodeles waltl]|uniref:Uncharacterized protein n=1 Tax=Pleurodeles waltl TaxID=8319 RepID=A0AAV7STJ1_PLEWA|nr:hypothetical protein NDU88_007804 [Pleurodeles waltl]
MIHDHSRQQAATPAGKNRRQPARGSSPQGASPQTSGASPHRPGRADAGLQPVTQSHTAGQSRKCQPPPAVTAGASSDVQYRDTSSCGLKLGHPSSGPSSVAPILFLRAPRCSLRQGQAGPHPLQQAGYLLRPDLAGNVPQAAKARHQTDRHTMQQSARTGHPRPALSTLPFGKQPSAGPPHLPRRRGNPNGPGLEPSHRRPANRETGPGPPGQSAPGRHAGPHTRRCTHPHREAQSRPRSDPTRPPEPSAAGAKIPPSSSLAAATPPREAQQQDAPQKRKCARPGPVPSGPRKHRSQPPPGACRQNRSSIGGPKGLQRRPSASTVARPDK